MKGIVSLRLSCVMEMLHEAGAETRDFAHLHGIESLHDDSSPEVPHCVVLRVDGEQTGCEVECFCVIFSVFALQLIQISG